LSNSGRISDGVSLVKRNVVRRRMGNWVSRQGRRYALLKLILG